MKVCIDGLSYFLNYGELGEYSRELVNALSTVKDLNLHLIKDTSIKKTPLKAEDLNLTLASLSINRKKDDYSPITNYLEYNNIHLYHCLNNGFSIPSNIKNTKIITTINGLLPLEFDYFYTSEYKEKYFKSLPRALEVSSAFICTTNALKEKFIKLCNVPSDKIHVIKPIVSDIYEPLNQYISSVFLRSKFNIYKDFILFSGDFHRRKRIEDLLEIFLRFSIFKEDVLLVFLTNINVLNFEYFNEIKELIDTLNLSSKVKFVTDFTDNDKVYFLNSALCYIDLSLYSTLDMSLVQAYSCRCKVICSNLDSHKEALNGRGIFIDLNDDLNYVAEVLSEIDNFNPYESLEESDNYYNSTESLKKLINLYNKLL